MAKKWTLLTGVTGLVGSFLLKEALQRGHSLAVVVRSKDGCGALQRFQAHGRSLGLGDELESNVRVVAGDLRQPGLGLSSEDRAWVKEHVSRVIHNAGSVSFHYDSESEEPYATNVDGTRMLLVLCRELELTEFHHVSTAYVCGLREGRILESELDCSQVFANPYERSKFTAEVLVREADFLSHRTIYRPSVVLGDFATGFTPVFHSAYILLWGAWALACQGWSGSEVLGVLGLQEERLNLVTADWCARTIWDLAVREASNGKTYHLTHQRPTSFRELFSAFSSRVTRPILSAQKERFEEGVIADTYRPYLREHPNFDRTGLENDAQEPAAPIIDQAALDRLADFAVRKAFRSHQLFPAQSFFESLNSSVEEAQFRFEVPGPKGGAWALTQERGRWASAPATDDGKLSRVTCSEAALSALVGGHWSLEEALYSGGVAIQLGSNEATEVERLLASLVEQMSLVSYR